MDTPQSISLRQPLRALCVLGLTLAAMAAWTGTANAHVSPAQAAHAADRGANWFQANQEASGSLGSDWAMTALAAAGINAADVSTSLADPTWASGRRKGLAAPARTPPAASSPAPPAGSSPRASRPPPKRRRATWWRGSPNCSTERRSANPAC